MWANRQKALEGVAAILAISGSMLWVGGPPFALFLIVKLLEFFWPS
jgi:hypothetical protein